MFTKRSQFSAENGREPVAVPGLFALLLVFHCLPDFLTKQALDFILHCLGAGGAEMRPHPVGGLADFLHHKGREYPVWDGGRSCLRWDWGPSLQLILGGGLAEILSEKRIGAHISINRSCCMRGRGPGSAANLGGAGWW